MGDTTSYEIHPELPHHDQIMSAYHMSVDKTGKTITYIHQETQEQILKTTQGKVNREKNPFCPIVIQPDINWITCCFISPLAFIASPLYLLDEKGYFQKECTIRVVYNGIVQHLPVKQVIRIQKYNFCVLFIQKPYYKVGWVGIKHINSIEELAKKDIRIINHPKLIFDQQSNKSIHEQSIKIHKANGKKLLDSSHEMQYYQDIIGSLVLQICEDKPYIIGLQAAEYETIFISENIFNQICNQTRKYCKNKFGGQTNVKKQLDAGLFLDQKMI